MQGRSLSIDKQSFIRLKSVLDLAGSEFLHLLRSASNKSAGVKERIKLAQDRAKESGLAHPFKQVVVPPVFLDIVRGLVGEDT